MKPHVCLTMVLVSLLAITSCADEAPKETPQSASEQETSVEKTEKIPTEREVISDKPVAEFSQRTDDPLNDWYFKVELYETKKTFHYQLRLQFEEIRGLDTLKLPNLGTAPKPVIRKGEERYSCIIGFMDHENNFREYKKVHVKNNSLKVTSLRHYAVSGN